MQLPKITKKQQEILRLLYTYRFLNRVQLQTLLRHKDHKTIGVWLKDLRDKHYIEWIYSTDFEQKTKPAIYYLGINGVRYLRSTGEYPVAEIRKRYYESSRSTGFISRSVTLADIAIELHGKSNEDVCYTCLALAAYSLPDSQHQFLANSDSTIHPDLIYTKQAGTETKTYLLELLDATLPRYRVRRRLKTYVEYLDYDFDEWQRSSGEATRPTVLFICPTVGELLYAKRRTRKLLENVPDSNLIHLKFTTIDEVQRSGVISKVWEEA
jgi:hypothetical protein